MLMDQAANQIMNLLSTFHRKLNTENTCSHKNPNECFGVHYQRVIHHIKNNQPIEFVLPAFPAKSPNIHKTAGPLPDLGERLALRFLNDLCEKIKLIYSPGAHIIICSDGRVFNDLVKVSDEHVDSYAEEIDNIISSDNLKNISTFGLDHYYKSISYNTMRSQLSEEYGNALSLIKDNIKLNQEDKLLFNGIHRFIFEDSLPLSQAISKNKLRNETKEIAYQVIQRSNAWSQLIKKIFPTAVRLSIHPQPCGSEKLGIMLLQSKDAWATPWHRVLLINKEDSILIRKKEAEEIGAKPVFSNNQFSHYLI
jgi:pyoverdine/dityrosine biosynthesis protein Dit1